MAMAFDPSAAAYLAQTTLYVTAAQADKGFIFSYDTTQTETDISPNYDTAAPGTLSTTTWP